MPKPINKLADEFINKTKACESTRKKIEAIFLSGTLSIADVEQVYAGLFLDIFTEFEALIEDLFIGLLTGKLYIPSSKNPRKLKIVPASSTFDVLSNGKKYLDWMPYKEQTKKRADRFFTDGQPFSKLTPDHIKSLEDYHSVRNALAHKSKAAIEKFKNRFAELTLLPKERTPAGYLMSTPQGTETQYQIAVADIVFMVNTLCSYPPSSPSLSAS